MKIWTRIKDIMGRKLAHPQAQENPRLVVMGRQLRAQRRTLGLTMEEVASASGVSRVTLQRVEQGKGSVSAGALASVADALGIPLRLETGTGGSVPEKIVVGDYPGLATLGWQLSPATVLAPYEAWTLYARNWPHMNQEILSDGESQLLEGLSKSFGDPSRV
jgi:transcriptional regulator with XRE-family HTH domain